MKLHPLILAGLTLLAGLMLTPRADAQPLWRWFGPKTPDKAPAAKPPVPDPRRVTEVNVEIAWLADPVTFPYYLEAHATADQLEIRGYVPNRSVRDHAIKIAQVHAATPVVDAMKEHPSLLVRPGQMAPQQLQNSAQSSLRVVLPKQYQHLSVEVSGEGKVVVAGPVNTYDEKLAVSHALRRLHGCTSVQNLTLLPAEIAKPTNFPTIDRMPPIITTSNQPGTRSDKPPVQEEPKAKAWQWPFGKSPATTKDEPPLPDAKNPAATEKKTANPLAAPVATGPMVVNEKLPMPPPQAPMLSVAALQKRVKAAWPGAKSVTVDFTSARELRILLEIADEKELTPAAERIFALPELNDARVDLQFKISGQ